MVNNRDVKFYPLHQCALYKCKSRRKMSDLLKCDIKEIKDLIFNIEDNYYSFKTDKKGSNEKRKITAPEARLKKVQSRVLALLSKVEKPQWVMSSTLKKSYMDNAEYHLNSNYFCKTDIKKFYDNCTRDRVYRFFKDKLRTDSDIAGFLTDLTTINNKIPTGTPSSQLIAYFAYEDMFLEMHDISEKYGYKMTLYVDDIVFSRNDYSDYKSMIREIELIAIKYNHALKHNKTRSYKGDNGAPITGVIVKENQKYIPNNLREGTIKLFSEMKDSNNFSDSLKSSLRGKVNSARLIEKEHFNGIYTFTKQNKNF